MRHLVLIGLSYSGKSTVGALVAERLGLPFVDTDLEIERRASRRVPDIFDTEGEAGFREIERQAVASVVAGPPSVVATGGGAPMDEANRRALWGGNLVVWLDVDPATVVQRLASAPAGTSRPLLAGDNPRRRVAELKERRQEIYQQAHVIVQTNGLSPEAVAQRVCEEVVRRVPQR